MNFTLCVLLVYNVNGSVPATLYITRQRALCKVFSQTHWHYKPTIKTRQRATLLLHTWIYFCRSGGAVNLTLPLMTNVTISISTSQIFRSWVAIFQPRPPMASLFRSLYGMPGLAPRMDVLSWGRPDFQISFSNRDTSRNAWNRHWGSFMVDTGISSNNMKFSSHKY